MRDGDPLRIDLPPAVAAILDALREAGHETVLVGGSVRDLVRGDVPADWDVATAAPPEEVAARFPGATWENPFGTVTVRDSSGGRGIEVTTYRVEAGYRDQRRPDAVRWGESVADDLARRDFTINAMAWMPDPAGGGAGRLIDPYGGAADMKAGLLRAVGDPNARFAEDALRLLRAVRFATRFGMRLDPATAAAIRAHAPDAAGLSGERVRDELTRILAGTAAPSQAFELMEQLGLLQVLLPELAALRGLPQAKPRAGDALDHSLRAADALPGADPVLRLAGLLHDVGKATTLADGHFLHHDREGALQAEQIMLRLRARRAEVTRVTRLVRHHMFAYTHQWTDAAVRRFVRRVGVDLLADLFALRAADDVASGVTEPPDGWTELRERVAATAGDPLEAGHLAISGDDLIAELGIPPGPAIGRLLAALLEAVLEDPELNSRERLLELASRMASA
jgi:tRNA nucleotidyltransferase (CCA-adding enzyme)